jgi:DNA-binding HxlR family transcriptional regulator
MPSSLSMAELQLLSRNRWAVALLADLAAHNGARFVELIHRLGLPRDSLVRTLDALKTAGWVMPNPGHGHPLRPEYVLSDQGKRIAIGAGRIGEAQAELGISPGSLTRWGLPLVRAIDQGHSRFNALTRTLAPASPRALSQSLRSLSECALVDRTLIDAWPPVSTYSLTPGGMKLARAAC